MSEPKTFLDPSDIVIPKSVSHPNDAPASGKEEPNDGKIRVYLAGNSLTELRRRAALLSSADDITVIGYSTTLSELETALYVRYDVHVLITDVTLADTDSSKFILVLKNQLPALNVLCLTDNDNELDVFSAIQHGATGYVLRQSGEDLASCVRLIHGGGSPVSPTIVRSVLRTLYIRANGRQLEKKRHDYNPLLSDRELEVLQLLSKGISFAEIGDVLNISTHTVTAHIKKIYRKLQVHSRGEAVYEAKCLGLLPDL